ncbi:MAG: primosomal protein N', primosomal protein N', replication factor Y, superfamily II helicase [Chloroflexi bacterium CSP1-4]|nr:MAG: primosomal protein N', primosomal protein N', replication factor Y, superfamily II helicase [Chloroflexi bacterium CSP1-4]
MAAGRLVELAVDVAGAAGGRTYTYHVPERLADLVVGEAVMVEFGRRQVLAIVVGEVEASPANVATKPVLERVRSDGPLLPPLQLALARHVAGHYLAPAALVVRAMLPPGMLERLELVSGWIGATPPPADDTVLSRIAASGPVGIAVRGLVGEGNRAALLRRLHAEAAAGRISLEWQLRPPDVRRRYERRARLTDRGREVAEFLAAGERPPGRPLGHRQTALLTELATLASGASAATAALAERHGAGGLAGLVRRGDVELHTVVVERRPLAGREREVRAIPETADLAPDQVAAAEAIVAAVRGRSPEAFLLEGVTASGKTAVYVTAIAAALGAGRGALVLVPEIALAAPLLDRLRTELHTDVAILHSGLGDGERADEWQRIRAGGATVVVGTRLAVLAPLADPGVVVVDEEHDPGYKSDRTPRYQARDLALVLGRLAAAPVVLGSATPDVASVGRAEAGEFRRLALPERVAGRAAAVEVVDLRAELAAGNRSLLSRPLADALGSLDTAVGERAILVLNRRGSASVVLCRDCGYVQVCPECRRPLVFHAVGMALRCHHCGATAPPASRCPACASPRIRYLGGGTERLEREVAERFPLLRVGRLDRDVVERKGAAELVVDAFTDGAIDVLVGTSLVTKGLDVPGVTLVGVVSADIALSLPDERAAERTYQLLRQAIGRAGRGDRAGRAIVQTYLPEHPVIRAVASGDASVFYREELAARRAFGSPPFGALVKLTVALEDRAATEAEGRRLASALRERAAAAGSDTVVLGPAPAYIARRAGRWRFHLVLRGRDPLATLGGDPGPPWSVDVDPESLL